MDRPGDLGPPPALDGRVVAILIESDYYEPEIAYYRHRFAEEGATVRLLSRLWGQPAQTFTGHEYGAPLECTDDLEDVDDATLASFAAVIVPSGMVADRLRYTEDASRPPPATELMARAFAMPSVVKGIICHGLWLLAPRPDLVAGRPLVVHNNLLGDARNMGAHYVDRDVVVDDDLVTGRTGEHCHQFARALIEAVRRRSPASLPQPVPAAFGGATGDGLPRGAG
jgi:protease I